MKRIRGLAVTLFTASLLLAAAGCTSTADLANKKNTVSSIKKLSKMLVKNPSDQEAADVFNELYNREMSSKLYIVQTTTPQQVLAEFARGMGESSADAALRKIAQNIPDRAAGKATKTVVDDSNVQAVLARFNELRKTYDDLEEIQKAVQSVPDTIGDLQTYTVTKYSDNFKASKNTVSDAKGDFYVQCAKAMQPVYDISENKKVAEIYSKAETEYASSAKKNSAKDAQYNIYMSAADEYLALAKDEIPRISAEAASAKNGSIAIADKAMSDAYNASDCYNSAAAKKLLDSKSKSGKKEADYYTGCAYLEAAKASQYYTSRANIAVSLFNENIDYKDSHNKLRDARALASDSSKTVYRCRESVSGTGRNKITIKYAGNGTVLDVNDTYIMDLSASEQNTYKKMSAPRIILWDNDFDFRVNGESQLPGNTSNGLPCTFTKDADGTIHATLGGKEIYTITTPDGGSTYVYTSGSTTYTFYKA